METFSALPSLCASKRPVTRRFDLFFDLHLNKRLSQQSSRRRWFEMPSHSLWRHCNGQSRALKKDLALLVYSVSIPVGYLTIDLQGCFWVRIKPRSCTTVIRFFIDWAHTRNDSWVSDVITLHWASSYLVVVICDQIIVTKSLPELIMLMFFKGTFRLIQILCFVGIIRQVSSSNNHLESGLPAWNRWRDSFVPCNIYSADSKFWYPINVSIDSSNMCCAHRCRTTCLWYLTSPHAIT